MAEPLTPTTASPFTRREFAALGAVAATAALVAADAQTTAATTVPVKLSINGEEKTLNLDPRVTLLDALREYLHLTGTKKGCDHGQCGACTVLINNRAINACLALAIAHEGDQITTIEGLAKGDTLHPMQAAFLENDGFQCGYCTPGQICSAISVVQQAKAGMPSQVTKNLQATGPVELTDDEIRERMSGNICRCGAYPNIVTAVRQAAGGSSNQRRSS